MKYTSALIAMLLCAVLGGRESQAQSNGAWSDRFGVDNGLNGDVYAIAIDDSGGVYVGGNFTQAGLVQANRVARWTGRAWDTLGGGFNDAVYALALSPAGELYAGGRFTVADGDSANRIARWTGERWEALGEGIRHSEDPGFEANVYALAVDTQGLVYVGGDFTEAGDQSARGIATWDGEVWQELGGGVDGFGCIDSSLDDVYAIDISVTGAVYVGGNFEEAGGVAVPGIARWTGSEWDAIGSWEYFNFCPVTVAVAVVDEEVYVGGSFIENPGQPALHIAKWTGTAWEPLGEGVQGGNRLVHAIGAGNSGVFVGGRFLEAGNKTVNRIAKWTGDQWEALGSGIASPGSVHAIGIHGSDVYVGGEGITEAGDQPSFGIALWQNVQSSPVERLPEDYTLSVDFDTSYPNPFKEKTTIVFSIPSGLHAAVKLEVFNVLGRRTATLIDAVLAPGEHRVRWTAGGLPGGVYMLRLQVGQSVRTRTIIKAP